MGVATPNHQHQEAIHRLIIMRLRVEQMPKVEHMLVQAQLTHMKADNPRLMEETVIMWRQVPLAAVNGLHPQARAMDNTLVRAMIHAEQLEFPGPMMMKRKGIGRVMEAVVLKPRVNKEVPLIPSIPVVTMTRVPASPTLIHGPVCRTPIRGLASLIELHE